VENRTIISLNGTAVSWMRLIDLLDLPPNPDGTIKKIKRKAAPMPAVLLRNGDLRIAVSVDELSMSKRFL